MDSNQKLRKSDHTVAESAGTLTDLRNSVKPSPINKEPIDTSNKSRPLNSLDVVQTQSNCEQLIHQNRIYTYSLEQIVGHGAFGTVYKGQYLKLVSREQCQCVNLMRFLSIEWYTERGD